ncbi:hypothetical protein KA093_03875, partial [Candidatus Saccharibacteria bacterium]|nr:hypothetical protein [Candidatus Saccharibacteria bacterium]
LALPTAQTDYFEQIVAHSRYAYSRPRSEVEQEIKSLIAPDQLAVKPSVPSNIPKTWPIEGATSVAEQESRAAVQTTPVAFPHTAEDQPVSTAKKRTRSRSRNRKKTSSDSAGQAKTPSPSSVPIAPPKLQRADDHELRLR